MTAKDYAPEWWRDYFTPLCGDVYAGPLMDPVATRLEADFLEQVFAGADGLLLDLGAGFGRHARELRKRGRKVVALDAFHHLLARHAKRGRRAVAADMRRPPFADASFAGAYCLFNSFGYFGEDEDQPMLAEWARVLRPGARLVLQAPNRPVMAVIARDFPPSHMLQSDFMLTETYEYDPATKTLHGAGAWNYKDRQQAWEMHVRLRTLGELKAMLSKAGFEFERACDDYDGAPFQPRESPQMVVVAKRSAKAPRATSATRAIRPNRAPKPPRKAPHT